MKYALRPHIGQWILSQRLGRGYRVIAAAAERAIGKFR
jgi:hypothetical protein